MSGRAQVLAPRVKMLVSRLGQAVRDRELLFHLFWARVVDEVWDARRADFPRDVPPGSWSAPACPAGSWNVGAGR